MKILIPGVSGAIGRKLAIKLAELGHEVIGIDARPWLDPPPGVEVHAFDIRKRAAEDVFRRRRPDAVVHMATVTSLVVRGEERYRINLGGTRAVFDHCRAYGVEHCIFVGRHTYYGAGPDLPLFHTEDEAPDGALLISGAVGFGGGRSLCVDRALALPHAHHHGFAFVLHARSVAPWHASRVFTG